jgi:hypothetical protein
MRFEEPDLSLHSASALGRRSRRCDAAGEPELNVARASIAQEIPVPAPAMLASAPDQQPPLPHDVLSAELAFYRSYDWCLNPHPTVREAVHHLREEIERLIGDS